MTDMLMTLHERGREAILDGTEAHDQPPGPASHRWGLSTLVRADGAVPGVAALTVEAVSLAGPGHWRTGRDGSAHLTILSLEPYRPLPSPDDPRRIRYERAVRTVAGEVGPVAFELRGLSLTPGGVVARSEPVNDAARAVRPRLIEALGEDAEYEREYRADAWWCSLLHFAQPVQRRAELVDWVATHEDDQLGTVTADELEFVHYAFDATAPGTRPETLLAVSLTGLDG